ncbi:hypothetical protein BDL97_10G104600 [Sphagnum fallax]|nr:hypothetical protein BDL97_10G104600 [Sphagnum fallax]
MHLQVPLTSMHLWSMTLIKRCYMLMREHRSRVWYFLGRWSPD